MEIQAAKNKWIVMDIKIWKWKQNDKESNIKSLKNMI